MGELAVSFSNKAPRIEAVQDCGKNRYNEARRARAAAYKHYRTFGTRSQVYKCGECHGYHLTTSRIKDAMSCPATKTFDDGSRVHAFTRRKTGGPNGKEWVASCIYCAVIIDTYVYVTAEQIRALHSALPANLFQERFRESILGLTVSRQVCLSENQQKFLESMCKK